MTLILQNILLVKSHLNWCYRNYANVVHYCHAKNCLCNHPHHRWRPWLYNCAVFSARLSVIPYTKQHCEQELDARLDGHQPDATFVSTYILHATYKLDYCNSLFLNIDVTQTNRLQAIQNALARAVTKPPKHHRITPFLKHSTGSKYLKE